MIELNKETSEELESLLTKFAHSDDVKNLTEDGDIYVEDLIADIWDALLFNKPRNLSIIEVDNIAAEAELSDLLEAFKQKYPLTKIV
jgi:hypothetical protein